MWGLVRFVLKVWLVFERVLSSMEEVVGEFSRRLAIQDDEDLEVITVDDPTSLIAERFWLVGKVLTGKKVNVESFRRIIRKIWLTKEEFSILEWENSERFVFSFKTEGDRRRVLQGSPWSFDNSLLVLVPTDGMIDPGAIPLTHQEFWIRVKGLPPALLTDKMGRKIGSSIGRFVMTDPTVFGDGSGSFLRLRIELKLAEPLRKGLRLQFDPQDAQLNKVVFEYEHLPHFCLFCGHLDHVGFNCQTRIDGVVTEEKYG
ncbi:uncharacterized protein LOC133714499 [Rosa rugosa]|uniref:uncharacterized protein LOC133714499 n=1 Tax=Rosa rugosa TaxID=74645 RepID=UPI002B40FBD6|nr:uncharacterized protein LOC133714499 [Rosa rugosa]